MDDRSGEDRKPPFDWEKHIEDAYRRVQAGLPPVPWLPGLPTLTGLRRQVRRARAGIVKPDNPRISTRAWADTIEQGMVMHMQELHEWRKQEEEDRRLDAELQQLIDEYNRSWMEIYRSLKRLPEASDATSEVAVQILAMKRELRRLRGRPRKRRR